MKRLDEDEREQYLKIGIGGENGMGKTWIGTTAPDPLILVFERQAVASIRASCASRNLEVPMMVLIESIEDCGNVLRAFSAPLDSPFVIRDKSTGEELVEFPRRPQSLVVDSITDACEMVRSELIRHEAPPRKDSETGLADESYSHRRVYTDRCIQLIKAFRNVPANVIFLSLMEEKTIYRQRKESGRRWVLQLPSKELQPALMAACNICGVMYRRQGKVGVILEGESWMPTKNMPPLRRWELPNINQWISRIHGTWKGETPEQPPEPEEAEESALAQRKEEKLKLETEETTEVFKEKSASKKGRVAQC